MYHDALAANRVISRILVLVVSPHKSNITCFAILAACAHDRCVILGVAAYREWNEHSFLPFRLRNIRDFRSLRHFFDLRFNASSPKARSRGDDRSNQEPYRKRFASLRLCVRSPLHGVTSRTNCTGGLLSIRSFRMPCKHWCEYSGRKTKPLVRWTRKRDSN